MAVSVAAVESLGTAAYERVAEVVDLDDCDIGELIDWEFESAELTPTCLTCGRGCLETLGPTGHLLWFRCRHCGNEQPEDLPFY